MLLPLPLAQALPLTLHFFVLELNPFVLLVLLPFLLRVPVLRVWALPLRVWALLLRVPVLRVLRLLWPSRRALTNQVRQVPLRAHLAQ